MDNSTKLSLIGAKVFKIDGDFITFRQDDGKKEGADFIVVGIFGEKKILETAFFTRDGLFSDDIYDECIKQIQKKAIEKKYAN